MRKIHLTELPDWKLAWHEEMLGRSGANYKRMERACSERISDPFLSPLDLIVDVMGKDIAAVQDHLEMISDPDCEDQETYKAVVSEACESLVMQCMTLVTGLHNEGLVDWDHIRKRLVDVESS